MHQLESVGTTSSPSHSPLVMASLQLMMSMAGDVLQGLGGFDGGLGGLYGRTASQPPATMLQRPHRGMGRAMVSFVSPDYSRL